MPWDYLNLRRRGKSGHSITREPIHLKNVSNIQPVVSVSSAILLGMTTVYKTIFCTLPSNHSVTTLNFISTKSTEVTQWKILGSGSWSGRGLGWLLTWHTNIVGNHSICIESWHWLAHQWLRYISFYLNILSSIMIIVFGYCPFDDIVDRRHKFEFGENGGLGDFVLFRHGLISTMK